MVSFAKCIIGPPRVVPHPAVVAEISAIQRDLDELTLHATTRCDALKMRIKTLGPSHAREVLLASVLRLLQNIEAETEERGRALGRCVR